MGGDGGGGGGEGTASAGLGIGGMGLAGESGIGGAAAGTGTGVAGGMGAAGTGAIGGGGGGEGAVGSVGNQMGPSDGQSEEKKGDQQKQVQMGPDQSQNPVPAVIDEIKKARPTVVLATSPLGALGTPSVERISLIGVL